MCSGVKGPVSWIRRASEGPLDELHDDPQPVLGLDQVVHPDHMRMRHPGDGPRLPDRPAQPYLVLLVAEVQDVQPRPRTSYNRYRPSISRCASHAVNCLVMNDP
ncbi:hypothetical protein ACQEWB_31900 [Streptomyces sp. CA-249302]|uniref:hypothetical protein n=1 Tax=Streptomyces sp. CA-249302 TaxID=3240058 RepID=UPI003D8F30D9